MATSYKLRMYRRRAFQHRYLIGITIWTGLVGLVVLIGINL